MALRVIDRETVRELLPYEACIPLMREAMMALSAGRTRQLLRQIIDLGEAALFGVMPGAMEQAFGAKLIGVGPPSAEGIQSHRGMVALFDAATSAPLAVLHAGELTAIRTAAASAAATQELARPEAHAVAVLGTGEQARTHAIAMTRVRPVSQIVIWGRDAGRAQALAQRLRGELPVPIRTAASVKTAVADADIICTTTAAAEPILEDRWVRDGTHINLVGSSRAGPREIDDDLVVRARFIADHREGVLRQGAEYLHARDAGRISEDHVIAEIGQVMSGEQPGRTAPGEVTLYKSLGSIVQDLAAGWFVYQSALAQGRGVDAPF
jgi:ornithine cyclodeaminase